MEQDKKKVIQILSSLPSQGAEKHALFLSERMIKLGWEPIIVSQGGHFVYQIDRMNIKHVEVPFSTRNPLKLIHNLKALDRLLKQDQASIVHIQNHLFSWGIRHICRKNNIPYITTVDAKDVFGSFFSKLYRWAVKKSHKTIVASDLMRRQIISSWKIHHSKLVLIPHGVDTTFFDPSLVTGNRLAWLLDKWNIPEDKKILTVIGDPIKKKEAIFLMSIIEEMLEKRDDFYCLIISQGERSKKIYKMIEQKFNNKVQVISDAQDITALYKLSTIVLPVGSQSCIRRRALEAQSMQKPVILWNRDISKEIKIDDVTGWYVKKYNQKHFIEALEKSFLLDIKQLEAVGIQARKNIEENFSKDIYCDQTISLYQKIIDQANL